MFFLTKARFLCAWIFNFSRLLRIYGEAYWTFYRGHLQINVKADVYDYKSGQFSIQIIYYLVYVTVLDSSAQIYLLQSNWVVLGKNRVISPIKWICFFLVIYTRKWFFPYHLDGICLRLIGKGSIHNWSFWHVECDDTIMKIMLDIKLVILFV